MNKETVFILLPAKATYRAAIVTNDNGVRTFVKWIKPHKYLHLIPDFLRQEFKSDKKVLRPKQVIGSPQ